jgi:hypothetical protein
VELGKRRRRGYRSLPRWPRWWGQTAARGWRLARTQELITCQKNSREPDATDQYQRDPAQRGRPWTSSFAFTSRRLGARKFGGLEAAQNLPNLSKSTICDLGTGHIPLAVLTASLECRWSLLASE